MNYMNDIFGPYLGSYFNDVMVFNKNREVQLQ